MPFEDEIIRIRAEVVERSARNAENRIRRLAEDMLNIAAKYGGDFGDALLDKAEKLIDNLPNHMRNAVAKADKDWERGWQKIATDGEAYLNKLASKAAKQAGRQAGNNFADSFNTAAKNKLDTHLITPGRGTGNRVAGRGTGAVNMEGLPYPIGATSPVPIESFESYQRRQMAASPIEGPDSYYQRQAEEANKLQAIQEEALNKERTRQRKLARESEATQRRVTSILRREERARDAIRDKALNAERKRQAEILVTRRATAARSLRIAAGLAGAMGNFRVASGLFTVSTGVQGMPTEYFEGGAAGLTKLASAALKFGPASIAAVAGIGAITAAVISLKKALQLEDDLAKVSTLLTTTSLAGKDFGVALRDIRHQAVTLSNTFNIDLRDAVEGFRTALSAGIDAPQLDAFTDSAAELSTALGSTFDESVNILTTLRDTYGSATGQMERFNNVVFNLVDEGKINVADLNTNLGRVASIASQAGVSFEEVAGALAFLTRQGLPASRAITSLSRGISAYVSPSEKARKAAEKLGIDLSATQLRTKGLLGVINDIKQATGGRFELLSQIIPEERAVRGIAAFTKNYEGLVEQIERANAAATGGDIARQAANRSLQSTQATIDRVFKAISNGMAETGIDFSRSLVDMIFGVQQGTAEERANELLRTLESVRNATAAKVELTNAAVLGVLHSPRVAFDKLFFQDTLGEQADVQAFQGRRYDRVMASARRMVTQFDDVQGAAELLYNTLKWDWEGAWNRAVQLKREDELRKSAEAVQGLADAFGKGLSSAIDKAHSNIQLLNSTLDEHMAKVDEYNTKRMEAGLTEDEKQRLAHVRQQLEVEISREIATRAKKSKTEITAITSEFERIQELFSKTNKDIAPEAYARRLRNIADTVEAMNVATGDALAGNLRDKAFILDTHFTGNIGTWLEEHAPILQKQISAFVNAATNTIESDISSNVSNSVIDSLQAQIDSLLNIGDTRGAGILLQNKRISEAIDAHRNYIRSNVEVSGSLEAWTRSQKKLREEQTRLYHLLVDGVDVTASYNEVSKRLEKVNEVVANKTKERAEAEKELAKQEEERLKNREELVKDLTSRVEAFEREHLEAIRDFEQQKTEAIKEQHEKRRSIIEETNNILRRTEESAFSSRLAGAGSDRQRRRIARQEMASVEEQVREAARSGDANAFYNAIQRYESLRDTRVGLTEGRRSTRISDQANSFIQRQVGDFRSTSLSTIGRDINNIERTTPPALDREALIKALTETTTSVRDMVQKLVNEDGNIVVDKSTNELKVIINGNAEWARELFTSINAKIDEQTNNRPTTERNEVSPPAKSNKPLGSRFGVAGSGIRSE